MFFETCPATDNPYVISCPLPGNGQLMTCPVQIWQPVQIWHDTATASFFSNICRFGGCGLSCDSLAELIGHIEENRIGKRFNNMHTQS